MRPVVVVDAVRTPIGARWGRLSGWHPADVAGELLRRLAERVALDPAVVDDVVLGCAMPVGSQGFNVARSALLAAGWPDRVPGMSVDRQASSSLAALAVGAGAVASGAAELVVAGGVEVMSTTPQGATLVPGAVPFGPAVIDRYRDAGGLVPAGVSAERLARRLGLSRADADAVAVASHRRATVGAELVPVPARILDREKGEVVGLGTDLVTDECARPDLTSGELAEYKPLYEPDGVLTAGNSAPHGDGAAAVLLASEGIASGFGPPLARLSATAVVGGDPVEAFSAAVPAAERVLAAAGITVADVDRIEVVEPFPPVVVAVERDLGAAPDRINVGGGGIAMGEPSGAVGARLVATLVHGLVAADGHWGLAVTAGSGLGAAVLFERLRS